MEALGTLALLWTIVNLTVFLGTHLPKLLLPPGTDVTTGLHSTTILRRWADGLPDWSWQLLTWPIFAIGYFVITAQCVETLALYLGWYVLLKGGPSVLSLMLLLEWTVCMSFKAWMRCKADFQAFLDLGPGGTPSTWNGFKRITLLAWFGRIDVLEPPKNELGSGFLGSLPQRVGQRPVIAGIAPQRQLDQRNSKEVFDNLLTSLDHFAAENTSHLHSEKSFLEKNTQAIKARCDCISNHSFLTFGCEIAHPHHVDGSLHAVLHPDDVRTVIEAGWGERHPIARADSWWCWWFFTFETRPPVPECLCLIYAPRTHFEVATVMSIVDAAACFVANRPPVETTP